MPPEVDTAAPAPVDTAAPTPAIPSPDAPLAPPPVDPPVTASPPPVDAPTTSAPPPPPADTLDNAQTDDGLNGSDPLSADDWTVSLDDDTRTLVSQKGYTSPNDLGKAYRELTAKLGERVFEPPAADADPSEWDAFHSKMGRPPAPDGYVFQLPQGVPENLPYDSNFATEFKSMAHTAGLSPRQAQIIHDGYVQKTAAQVGALQEQADARVEAAQQTIMKEWGAVDSDSYRRQVELARRTIKQFDLADSFVKAGLMEPGTGAVTDPKVAFAMARAGSKMFAEDAMFSGPGAGIENPFSDKTANMTQQSLLIKNDPHRAASLIRAAGKKTSDFGLPADG